MLLADAALSALLNLVLFAGFPFLLYFLYHTRERKRELGEIAQRAGLQLGERRYLGYSVAFAFACIATVVAWPPPLEPLVRQGSGSRQFVASALADQLFRSSSSMAWSKLDSPRSFYCEG